MKPNRIALFLLVVIIASGFILPIEITNAFEPLPRSLAWELVEQTGETRYDSKGYPYAIFRAQPGERVDLFATVRNMSRNPKAQVWYGTSDLLPEGNNYPNAHAIGLGTWAPIDHIPTFLDASSFVINNNRLAYYDGPPVHRGELMALGFQVRLADNLPDGVYDLTVSLVREFDEWGWRDNGKGQNHYYRSMLWRFVVGEAAEVLTYDPYGGDMTFDYPSDWEVVPQGYSVENNSVLYAFLNNPNVSGGDYESAVYLYPIGTPIDSAIQMFHESLNDYWKGRQRTVTNEMTNSFGRTYKQVTYIGATGSSLNSWFVKNEHNFVVRVASDSQQYYWVGGLVANSIR